MGTVIEFDETRNEIDSLIERLSQVRDGEPVSPTDLMMVIEILNLVSEYIKE